MELLSKMNHPAGDCPLCLYPLVPEDTEHLDLAFMKLMSCFHCFHRSECILALRFELCLSCICFFPSLIFDFPHLEPWQ